MSVLDRPATINHAVAFIIARLPSVDRERIRAMPRKDLFELHHGFGTWVRNALLHVAGGNAELVADCARVLEAARKERIAKNPVLASLDPRFEELRPPIDFDDCSMVIIERVWEALNARDVH